MIASLLVFFLGMLQTRKSSYELVQWLQEKALNCRRSFVDELSSEYQEGVRGFFVEYATMFEGIRRHVAELKMKLKPQLDLWDDYFLELNAIDQELESDTS